MTTSRVGETSDRMEATVERKGLTANRMGKATDRLGQNSRDKGHATPGNWGNETMWQQFMRVSGALA